ncbi:hypothetical protein FA13DRAFT_1716202 [Coprinellus micaceus]|uniref:Uncharacterized protein n=1 Tax=Coprinellus micaceus TaxID=71717 RepID=A0A4Y7SLZ4_COPMI|nr:hypothetical protein FA13DRAFT_1716202 [Coprinellus micaceus]
MPGKEERIAQGLRCGVEQAFTNMLTGTLEPFSRSFTKSKQGDDERPVPLAKHRPLVLDSYALTMMPPTRKDKRIGTEFLHARTTSLISLLSSREPKAGAPETTATPRCILVPAHQFQLRGPTLHSKALFEVIATFPFLRGDGNAGMVAGLEEEEI